jgi:hypothetical protein
MSTLPLYASPHELKDDLRIAATNETYDLMLETALEAVCRAIDDYTGRRFYSTTGTRYYTAEDSQCLPIDDLLAVSTLKTDEDGDGTYETTWSSTCYYLQPDNASHFGQPFWELAVANNSSVVFPTDVKRGVEINGTWGYNQTTAVPAPVRKATLFQAARDFRAIEAPLGTAGGPEFGQDVSPSIGLHPFCKRLLDTYRVPVVK